ncbi:hypothetical protein P6F26_01465 [Roseibacterium sp. SDUM158017]|uniref:hypothetical protein n=1 Tax=Roseicyclus salinarum TaxID=3036773 RepID=UPI002414FC7D|nr:hypothetical protein [Roseibacterium sp. SDUM158017]MDG4647101.1 hypothetical protein [Roseibacterium sp. SDUM158017]
MALPIAPVAGLALRYGAVALAAYAASRALERGRLSQPVEDEMDATPEGMTLRREDNQLNGSGRFRRVARLGRNGPGVAIDATILGRFRMDRA